MRQQRASKALFMVFLVLTMPLYSSMALAATTQITQNHGNAGVDQYLDGLGDSWHIEVSITDTLEPVSPEQVEFVSGSLRKNFDSCAQSPNGYVCSVDMHYPTGIVEGDYPFDVIYHFTNEVGSPDQAPDAGIAYADGSDPSIRFTKIEQNGQRITIDFGATDQPGGQEASGIGIIDVIDVETGRVLEQITFDERVRNYEHETDLQIELDGEQETQVKLRVSDRLGHTKTSLEKDFAYDFLAPRVINLSISKLGEFIGTGAERSDIVIHFEDASELGPIKAYSDQAELNGQQCQPFEVDDDNGIHKCTFNDVKILPSNSITIRLEGADVKGNALAEGTSVSQSFTVDDDPPLVEYLGSEFTYQGVSVVQSGLQTIYMVINEQGSGIRQQDVRLLLGADASSSKTADECNLLDSGKYTCVFNNVNFAAGVGSTRIGAALTDRVGNEGVGADGASLGREIKVDDELPTLETITFISVSDAGEQDFFKSRDNMRIELLTKEENGVLLSFDLRDLIADADTVFPGAPGHEDRDNAAIPDPLLSPGFFVVDAENDGVCERAEGGWFCAIDVPAQLKSGPDPGAQVKVRVYDTARNIANSYASDERTLNAQHVSSNGGVGLYTINLLGLDEENDPDYWENQKNPTVSGFIDIKTAHLVGPRVPVQFFFQSDVAKSLDVSLNSCEAGSEDTNSTSTPVQISKSVIFGAQEGLSEVTPQGVIEFAPFEAEDIFAEQIEDNRPITVNVLCDFTIFSKVGANAISTPEIQQVEFSVPISYSTLTGQEENIDKKIKEARDGFGFGFLRAMATAQNAIEWVERIMKWVLEPLMLIIQIVNFVDLAFDAGKEYPPAYTAFVTACYGNGKIKGTLANVYNYMQIPTAVLTCGQTGHDGYNKYQKTVLETYNNMKLNSVAGIEEAYAVTGLTPMQAGSLKDNLVISVAGACIPGIIENLDKMANIQCRYIYCLENEVATGVPGQVCEELKNQMICKYVLGETVMMWGLFDILDSLAGLIKKIITDPIGAAMGVFWYKCSSSCNLKGGWVTTCNILGGIKFILDAWGWLEQAINNVDPVHQDYCSKIDDGAYL